MHRACNDVTDDVIGLVIEMATLDKLLLGNAAKSTNYLDSSPGIGPRTDRLPNRQSDVDSDGRRPIDFPQSHQ